MDTTKREIISVKIQSCSDGTLIIRPKYKQEPIEKHATPVGVFTRMAIASELATLINKKIK